MLYELIQFFGTDEAARMLGFELGKESRKQFGSDAYYDAYYSETNLRSVWFLWSLTFLPSNLRDSFHLQTWGYYNTEFTGPVADACRASALHRLKKVHTQRKKTRSEKQKETLARRLAKLPPQLRYVQQGPRATQAAQGVDGPDRQRGGDQSDENALNRSGSVVLSRSFCTMLVRSIGVRGV